eukprot:1195832-Prorocentrum_minimum.AAC.1
MFNSPAVRLAELAVALADTALATLSKSPSVIRHRPLQALPGDGLYSVHGGELVGAHLVKNTAIKPLLSHSTPEEFISPPNYLRTDASKTSHQRDDGMSHVMSGDGDSARKHCERV